MNQKFANDLYITSLQAAEKASVDSIQQQRFLAIISEPQFPEEEWMNWRHRGFLTLISIFLIIFSFANFKLVWPINHKNKIKKVLWGLFFFLLYTSKVPTNPPCLDFGCSVSIKKKNIRQNF